MPRDSRFDVLFEPLAIGPVTAKNRFYQVPHCNGMGRRYPLGEAAMRGVKAEGGWGVVCTQECEIHWSSDIEPVPDARLWDDEDIPALARVVIATGATWRREGIGRRHRSPVPGSDAVHVYTPDDIARGASPAGPVLVFDDDHYYLGGVLAEKLRLSGLEVVLVTPAPVVSAWTVNTMEQARIQRRLIECGVDIRCSRDLAGIGPRSVETACVYAGRRDTIAAASVVMVSSRVPDDALYRELTDDGAALADADIRSVDCIGDCLAPSTIANAVFAGHRYARDLDEPVRDGPPVKREPVAM